MGKELELTASMQADFETRFLSKICLAIGYNLLGDVFLKNENSNILRKHFREANSEARKELSVKQTNFFVQIGIEKYFHTDAKWLLAILNFSNTLWLLVKCPDGQLMVAVIVELENLNRHITDRNKSLFQDKIWVFDSSEIEERTFAQQVKIYESLSSNEK